MYVGKRYVFQNKVVIFLKRDVLEIQELFLFFEKNKCLRFIFILRIEKNVCVRFWVSVGTDYFIRGLDSNVYAEFFYNVFRRGLDGQSDRRAFFYDNFGFLFVILQFRDNRNRDVGFFVFLRVAIYEKKEEISCRVDLINYFCFRFVVLYFKVENNLLNLKL